MTGMKDPPLDIIVTPDAHTMITRIDPDSVAPDLAPITTDIGVVAARTPAEVTPSHYTDLPAIVSCIRGAPVPTTTAMTHLTTDLHLIGNTSRDDHRSQHKSCKQHYRPACGSLSTS